MKLIYVAYGNVSVFDSQVVSLLNYYKASDKFKDIILIVGKEANKTQNSNRLKNLNASIQVQYYDQHPQYPIIEKRTISSLRKVFKSINAINEYIFHVRNEVTAHYVYKALNYLDRKELKIIADVRGAGLEQLLEFSNKGKLTLFLKKTQRKQVNKTLSKIKNISVVSKALENYVRSNVEGDLNIHINSCIANKNFSYDLNAREKLRSELQIEPEESLIVLSTGGNNAWQNTEKTIESLAQKKFKVLNLSRSKINNSSVISMFVPYLDVNKYLSAADIAIIWRENSVTNKVASPVKFSEYICCGLPVITNEAIDLVKDYINKNDCGKILDSIVTINSDLVNELKKINRKEISEKGIKDFGIDTIANQYISFYQIV